VLDRGYTYFRELRKTEVQLRRIHLLRLYEKWLSEGISLL
jgi:hypothetical protein